MSKYLQDNDLEYLMTSDFIENYKPDEYKNLLFKFRDFYKLLYNNFKNYKNENELQLNLKESLISSLNTQLYNEKVNNSKLENEINQLKNIRKLSWRERISGKTNPIN
jgi:predicted RNase H-like nuclease (RuvC/YqgF family)